MMKTLAIATTLVAACLGTVVLAQPAPPPAPPAARSAPVGPAAAVTRAQVQARVQQRIAAMDANRDGTVTRAEFDAQRTKARGDRWAGREAARTQRREGMFAMLDTNKDGQISRAEFATAPAPRAMNGGPRGRGMARPGGAFADRRGPGGPEMRGRGMPHAFAGRHADAMFARMDANKDGRITLAEAAARPLARFDRLDANKDGTVTPEERRAARAGLRGPGRIMRG